MKKQFYLLLLSAVTWGVTAMAQEARITVRDAVNLPEEIWGQPDRAWYLVSQESWMVSAHRPGIQKTVNSFKVQDHRNPEADEDSLLIVFGEICQGIPIQKGTALQSGMAMLGKVTYEFMLMDPETGQINTVHAPVSSLVSRHSAAAHHYRLNDQLLSVDFHETWSVEPSSLRITKKVDEVTPVIWQRRQTTGGEPVDDAESGLPVYYKIRLESIPLRNP